MCVTSLSTRNYSHITLTYSYTIGVQLCRKLAANIAQKPLPVLLHVK